MSLAFLCVFTWSFFPSFNLQSHRHSRHARPVGFTVSVVTFWKTLFYLYTFSELGGGAKYRVGNTFVQELFIVLLPVSVWVIVPFAVIVALWPCMAQKEACDCSGGERQDLRKKTGEERKKEAWQRQMWFYCKKTKHLYTCICSEEPYKKSSQLRLSTRIWVRANLLGS